MQSHSVNGLENFVLVTVCESVIYATERKGRNINADTRYNFLIKMYTDKFFSMKTWKGNHKFLIKTGK